jgi:4-oxalocrotonate tautomerase
MPVVIVEMWKGRTVEQKKLLFEGITDTLTRTVVPKEALHIIIQDMPKHNWGHAGRLTSETGHGT